MKTIACRDIGLNCDDIIKGTTEEDVLIHAEEHAWKIHAIKSEEITSEMKDKIKYNIHDT